LFNFDYGLHWLDDFFLSNVNIFYRLLDRFFLDRYFLNSIFLLRGSKRGLLLDALGWCGSLWPVGDGIDLFQRSFSVNHEL
jgi:hypothetical protein